MKKTKLIFSIIAFALCWQSMNAQDNDILFSDNGKIMLPQTGNFAIGIDAGPIFDFAGNLFSQDGYNSLDLHLINNEIYAKYILSPKNAIRLKFRVYNTSGTRFNDVADDLFPGGDEIPPRVTDENKYSSKTISFSPGYEFRKGSNRLQVIYGGELDLRFSNSKQDYIYANAFSTENTAPTSTVNFVSNSSYGVNERTISQKAGNVITAGVRAFTGLEYFFLPKISIGGEIGIGYYYQKVGDTVIESENWDFTNNELQSITTENPGSTYTNCTTDILSGQIVLMFYL